MPLQRTVHVVAAIALVTACGGRSSSGSAARFVPCDTPSACDSAVAKWYGLHLRLPQQSGLRFLSGHVGRPLRGAHWQYFATTSYLDSVASLHFSVNASQVLPLAPGELDPTACPDNAVERSMVTPKGRAVCIRNGPSTQSENRTLKMTLGSVIYIVTPEVRTAVSGDWLAALADSFA